MIVEPSEVKLTIGANVIQTGDSYDWTLTHITDDTFMVADVKIGQYANKDGGYIKKRRYESREVTMYILSKLESPAQIDATWLQLKNYMDCLVDAELELTTHGVTRTLIGTITEVKKADENGMPFNAPADIKVVFTAPDPWFRGAEASLPFVSATPLFMAPLTIISSGLTVGVITSGNSKTFTVGGNAPAEFLLTLTARGAVVNPCVTNADGDYVKALKTMADGDVITIYTGDEPYVRYNGALCPRDKLCTFFKLALGSNTITITADSGVSLLTKLIEFRERYQ